MDFTPKPHVLRSLASQGILWWKALAELIDNSLDAGAMRVSIVCSKRTVEITDDGFGMKDIASAIILGDHNPSDSTKLGAYGIGLKDAWLFAGERIDIETVRGGKKSTITVDINDFLSSGSWIGPDPKSEPYTGDTGTKIRLYLASDRLKPSKDTFERLGWVFAPAIDAGRQIVVSDGRSKEPLKQSKLPDLSDIVEETFAVNGKEVYIKFGITSESTVVKYGPFWLQYQHRNIANTNLGSKGYGSMRVAGLIRLGKGWKLTKNKDDLAELVDDLAEEINKRIKDLLDKAGSLAEDIETKAIKHELESMLNNAVGEAKREARNSTKESCGTVKPANTGRKRKVASKVHELLPGSIDRVRGTKRTGFTLSFGNIDDERLGRFDPLTSHVELNLLHRFVSSSKSTGNKQALFGVAGALISEYVATHDGSQKKLGFEFADFGTLFGKFMNTMECGNDPEK